MVKKPAFIEWCGEFQKLGHDAQRLRNFGIKATVRIILDIDVEHYAVVVGTHETLVDSPAIDPGYHVARAGGDVHVAAVPHSAPHSVESWNVSAIQDMEVHLSKRSTKRLASTVLYSAAPPGALCVCIAS
ncbi:unnamed protein product [Arctia plantaginis]|uniref:Uncharacterized protein n=1 Tax=Arctia plantaginis TaxID=874455 RepID=A0A8S0ZL09_ARCPL|nr:unnamed protein product [Arctia plantaginis]